MKEATDQLETQLADLAKRLGSARFWADRETHRAWPLFTPLYWRAEVLRLEAEFARLNARLARRRRKRKGEG